MMELGSATLGRVSSERRTSSPAHIFYSVADRPLFPAWESTHVVSVYILESTRINTFLVVMFPSCRATRLSPSPPRRVGTSPGKSGHTLDSIAKSVPALRLMYNLRENTQVVRG